MGHAADADELFEVARDKLRPVVGDDARTGLRIFFLGAFQNRFHIAFFHLLTNFPVHDQAAATIQDAA